jgi:cell division protein FtsZ
VLHQGVRGITDLMIMPGLINLDFADIRTVMSEMGKAMMGTGEATGDRRAIEAAEKAIANPLLDEVSMRGAKGVIINITGGDDLRLMEVDEAATHIRDMVDPDANIIVGSAFNKDLEGVMRVSVVATGIDAASRPAQVTPRARPAAFAGATANIFTAPPPAVPRPEPVVDIPEPVETPVAVAEAEVETDLPDIEIETAEEEEIDLAEVAELIEEPSPADTFRFTPTEAPVVPIAPAAAAPAPEPETAFEEERTPTLFEKMMNLSRGSKPKPPSASTLAPEPTPGTPDVDIPPFFKRQVNN